MIGVGALKGAVTGLAGIAGGIIGSGARKREQKAAQAEFNRNKARMENADTSNLAMNQENTMEDLTVNTQQADFIAQQQNQGIANAQAASASIGQQEAGNQMAERRMAGQLQNQELQGAYASRAAEKDKTDTMLGMSQNRLGAANAARDAATSSIIGGVAGVAGAGLDVLGGPGGMIGH